MAREITLTAPEANDPTIELNVELDGVALSLVNLVPQMLIKASRGTDDTSALATLTVGDGLTLGDTDGQLTAVIPHDVIATPGTLWWRLDVYQQTGEKDTALYGPLIIQDV